MTDFLSSLSAIPLGKGGGITSVCSAHPWVIEATLRHALKDDRPVLIEATCNQVNQFGGYTGMKPADFRAFVEAIAHDTGFPVARLILGGDHLGPNPWRDRPAEEAMRHARDLVGAYVRAGFTKIHLDASMGCKGESAAVGDDLAASRAAELAMAAEQAADQENNSVRPLFVIGTEVPTPGGALEALDHVAPTSADAARLTYEAHAEAFRRLDLDDALSRVIALVVQPGVEFGDAAVLHFNPQAAAELSTALGGMKGITFEAHSTDYQTLEALAALVRNGFRILKVGPWLTFAMREALYGLDAIATELVLARSQSLKHAMERLMVDEPDFWQRYYDGDATTLRIKRHYSLSDRIRYYWPHSRAQHAIDALLQDLGNSPLPMPLVGQYLGRIAHRFQGDETVLQPKPLIVSAIQDVLEIYSQACTKT
ncbi:MAG: D-tagatose-bisphosphate aldolase, class II, non-catalytic subunit [Methylobacterium mesophilicum]|nr:D-tagatose-bisphosphate aldolase, class II, non-catalytic subunit [Methylobacterium mesophilicum]